MTRNAFNKLLLSCLMLLPLPAVASGGDWPQAVFVHEYNPPDLRSFYARDLGVLLPTYRWRHLTIAYRRMEGLDVTPDEAARLDHSYWRTEQDRWAGPEMEEWRKARRNLGLPEVNIETDIATNDYEYLANCSADAFKRARERLAGLVADHGASDRWVVEWLKGQDAVFTNCSKEGTLPDPVPAEAPAWLREERLYQIASVRYYRGEYAQAVEAFSHLASDVNSPLSPLAAYLVARSKVRLAEQGVERPMENADQAPPTEPALSAETVARHDDAMHAVAALQARSREYPYRLAALQLEGQLEASLYPVRRTLALNDALLAPRLPENGWQDLWDYTVLAPKWGPDTPIMHWIRNFQSADHGKALQEARVEWQRSGKTGWLVSALLHAAQAGGDANDLLVHAAAVPKSSAAWLSLGYYRVKLLEAAGRIPEARELTARLLAEPAVSGSARNLLLDEAAAMAEGLPEFAAVALERPVNVDYPGSENGEEGSPDRWAADDSLSWRPEIKKGDPLYFSEKTALHMNANFSAAQLRTLLGFQWPAHIRRDLLLTVWTRALLADSLKDANDIASQLEPFFPESASLLQDFRRESSPDRRRLLATIFVLRTPGATPLIQAGLGRLNPPDKIGSYDYFRWWRPAALCAARTGRRWAYETGACKSLAGEPPGTPAQQELAAMAREGAPSTFAGKLVLAYASAHEQESYLPEALHLVVKASRYGDNDCESGRYSKQAFALLNKRFKGSEWQKKTPSWYDNAWGCDKQGS